MSRICPFHGCGRKIGDSMFACGKHWYSLNRADQMRVHEMYADYTTGKIGIETLRHRQNDVLRSRGSAYLADGIAS